MLVIDAKLTEFRWITLPSVKWIPPSWSLSFFFFYFPSWFCVFLQLVVEEMNILTTVFLRYDNQKVLYPNSTLSTKSIGNYYRSPDMGDSLEFLVHISTPAEKIAAMKQRITRQEINPIISLCFWRLGTHGAYGIQLLLRYSLCRVDDISLSLLLVY